MKLLVPKRFLDVRLFPSLQETLKENQISARMLRLWFAASLLAGIYLVFAIPVTLPGDPVELVQNALIGFNFLDLVSNLAGSSLIVLLLDSLFGLVLFVLSVVLVQAKWPEGSRQGTTKPVFWTAFAIPMLLVWSIALLAFWPAVMSLDSIHQWMQVQSGNYNNAHPIFHTLVMWVFSRFWNTPTVVAIAQILILSLLVSWALGSLTQKGLPAWAAWAASLLFALSPVNIATILTLWKDILYSISILGLAIMVLQIALDERKWLERKWAGWILGLLVACITLFRHNGIVVGPPILLVLGLVYRHRWQVFARSWAVFLVLWLFIQGPAMSLLDVKTAPYLNQSLPLHHIAAHIDAGTPLEASEEEMVLRILPAVEWSKYRCELVNTLIYTPKFNEAYVSEHGTEIYRLAFRLFLKYPTVDLNHTICAGSLIWRARNLPGTYIYTTEAYRLPDGNVNYITANQHGLRQESKITGLTEWLVNFLDWSREPDQNALIWRPAFYLYLYLFIGCVLALRARSWKVALYMLPGLVQSATLFLVNMAQDFRYQYAVYLLGLFSLALLFLPFKPKENTKETSREVVLSANSDR